MKRTIFVLSTIVVFMAVFAVLVVRKAEATPNLCPNLNATLNGNYGLYLWAPGTYVSPYASPSTGWDFSMLANFDGSGTFNGSHVYAVRGAATVPGSDASFLGAAYRVVRIASSLRTPPNWRSLATPNCIWKASSSGLATKW